MPDASNGYEACAAEFIKARRSIGAAHVRTWAALLPDGADVLELGCGFGVPISQALIESGLKVYGVDASPSMLAEFRKRFPHATVECRPVEESSLFDRKFDGVVAWGLIFLLNPETQISVIGKAAAALNEGGRFVFTAPAQVCTWNDVLTGRESVSLGREAYVSALRSAGLELVAEFDDEGNNHYYSARR